MANPSVTVYGINTYQHRIDVEVSATERQKAEGEAIKACRKAEKPLLADGYYYISVQISPQGRGRWLFTYTYRRDKV